MRVRAGDLFVCLEFRGLFSFLAVVLLVGFCFFHPPATAFFQPFPAALFRFIWRALEKATL